MTSLAWIHLSDWHQKGDNLDQEIVRDALVADVRNRSSIDERLSKIHFAVISGDIAYNGKLEEYVAAKKYLIAPFSDAAELENNGVGSIFFAPGNHDFNRDAMPSLSLSNIHLLLHEKAYARRRDCHQDMLRQKEFKQLLQRPFLEYNDFMSSYCSDDVTVFNDNGFAAVHRITVHNKTIAVLCLNSAWLSGLNKDCTGRINDYGYLAVGEEQIRTALMKIATPDLVIAVMHHPISWLQEFDANLVEEWLFQKCHFVLHGHKHLPKIDVLDSTTGGVIVVPSGAVFNGRDNQDQRYENSYNFVHLDLDKQIGTIHFRRWNVIDKTFVPDAMLAKNDKGCFHFFVPKQRQQAGNDARHGMSALVSRWEPDLMKRPFERLEVELDLGVHLGEAVSAVKFDIHFRCRFSPGKKEKLGIQSVINSRVYRYGDGDGARPSLLPPYKLHFIRLDGREKLSGMPRDGDSITFQVELPVTSCDLEYKYVSYDLLEDFYKLAFNRMAKKFLMRITKSSDLEIEVSPTGDLPMKEISYNEARDAYEVESSEMVFPGMGLTIQWFPSDSGRLRCSSAVFNRMNISE